VAKADKSKRNDVIKDASKREKQTNMQNNDKKELFDAELNKDREDPTKYPAW